MQIVIDIDDETLQDLYDSRYVSSHIKDVFRSATPLPKGHGNLIDGDALLTQGEVMYGKDEQPYLVCTMNTICNALYCDTLIEADRSEDT